LRSAAQYLSVNSLLSQEMVFRFGDRASRRGAPANKHLCSGAGVDFGLRETEILQDKFVMFALKCRWQRLPKLVL
jgi:hypothetical protein